ncbi:helix-turn-helix domain-containing protein [Pseudonocardia sp.]|uniref:helix-turn-helix domain-containing protein n=1 Tax=Pseudonocardia sp. TaxID=60912 RepID=UPI0039C9A233
MSGSCYPRVRRDGLTQPVPARQRATATRLGIHPNTLDYRLQKAAQVGGIDITNSEKSFRFQLAVRLLPICSRKSWLTGQSTERHSDDC